MIPIRGNSADQGLPIGTSPAVSSSKASLVRENLKYLALAAALFIVGMAFGIVGGSSVGTEGSGSIFDGGLDSIFEELESISQFYVPYQPFTVVFLFFKNLLTTGMTFILGPLIIMPAAVLLLNGYILGMVGTIVANEVSLVAALASLAPHGVFEMPALVIAAAAALRFGVATLKKIRSMIGRSEFSISNDFEGSVKLFVLSTILLFVAAIMETYVTPMLMGISP